MAKSKSTCVPRSGSSATRSVVGALLSPRTCPHCGRAPDFEDEETVVEDQPREPALRLVR